MRLYSNVFAKFDWLTLNDDERKLFALPPHLGGLGIVDPLVRTFCISVFSASVEITAPLIQLILQHSSAYSAEVSLAQFKTKRRVVYICYYIHTCEEVPLK